MDRHQWLFEIGRDLFKIAALITIVAIPVTIFMGHLKTKQQIIQAGYHINQATHEHRVLSEENKKLSIEAAIQGRSDRVVSLAKERFGLEPARHDQVLIIPVDSPDDQAEATQTQRHASLGM